MVSQFHPFHTPVGVILKIIIIFIPPFTQQAPVTKRGDQTHRLHSGKTITIVVVTSSVWTRPYGEMISQILLNQKPYPMPKINEILLKLEGFQYATSLDLNMVYYHIRLRENASNLCTIIIQWVNIVTNVYQWELLITQTFFNRR